MTVLLRSASLATAPATPWPWIASPTNPPPSNSPIAPTKPTGPRPASRPWTRSSCSPGPGDDALLRLVRERDQGNSTTPSGWRHRSRGARRDHRAGELVPAGRALPLSGVAAAHLRGRPPRVPPLCRPDAHRGRHHRPGGHHPHPRAPGPERRTRPPIPEPAPGPMPQTGHPRRPRATSVVRSRSAPLPIPDPGLLGAPAAHRQSLAARFSTQPRPALAPNTPDSPEYQPRPPPRCVVKETPIPRRVKRTLLIF